MCKRYADESSFQIDRYRDSRGNEISKHNLKAMQIQTGEGLDKIEKKAKDLFDSLNKYPSRMLGEDDKKKDKNRVFVPHHYLDRCVFQMFPGP